MTGLTRQLIVDGRRGGIAISVQGLLGGPRLGLCKLQLLFNFFNDPTPSRVYAEVLKRLLEVRNVGLSLDLQHLKSSKRYQSCALVRHNSCSRIASHIGR